MIVGYDRPHFDAAQKDWVKYHVFLHLAVNATDAIEKFSAKQYLAVIASYDLPDMMSLIKVVRETEQIPFVLLSQEDSGIRIAESIIRGADTFIIDPDKLIESLTKNKDIIERLSRLPSQNKQALGILTHRDIFMLIDYRKVFVRGREVSPQKASLKSCNCFYQKPDGRLPMSRFICMPMAMMLRGLLPPTPFVVISAEYGSGFP